MAYITSNRTHSASFGQRLVDIRDAATEAYGKWRTYRQTLSELQALSRHELDDLGIHSSMIRSIALEAAYGEGL